MSLRFGGDYVYGTREDFAEVFARIIERAKWSRRRSFYLSLGGSMLLINLLLYVAVTGHPGQLVLAMFGTVMLGVGLYAWTRVRRLSAPAGSAR